MTDSQWLAFGAGVVAGWLFLVVAALVGHWSHRLWDWYLSRRIWGTWRRRPHG